MYFVTRWFPVMARHRYDNARVLLCNNRLFWRVRESFKEIAHFTHLPTFRCFPKEKRVLRHRHNEVSKSLLTIWHPWGVSGSHILRFGDTWGRFEKNSLLPNFARLTLVLPNCDVFTKLSKTQKPNCCDTDSRSPQPHASAPSGTMHFPALLHLSW